MVLESHDILATGGYADVYRGYYGAISVAIKRVRVTLSLPPRERVQTMRVCRMPFAIVRGSSYL